MNGTSHKSFQITLHFSLWSDNHYLAILFLVRHVDTRKSQWLFDMVFVIMVCFRNFIYRKYTSLNYLRFLFIHVKYNILSILAYCKSLCISCSCEVKVCCAASAICSRQSAVSVRSRKMFKKKIYSKIFLLQYRASFRVWKTLWHAHCQQLQWHYTDYVFRYVLSMFRRVSAAILIHVIESF